MIVNVVVLKPMCSRCKIQFRVKEMYLTPDKELMFVGFCPKCKDNKRTLIVPLAELQENCPAKETGFTVKDISDLHQMGVILPRDSP